MVWMATRRNNNKETCVGNPNLLQLDPLTDIVGEDENSVESSSEAPKLRITSKMQRPFR
jgi:hypothetical protein